jgi:hypothetical protein
MSFETSIQNWVSIDNQIKLLNDKMKLLREKKQSLHDSIITHVKNNNINNSTVQISDGKLKFVNTKITEPLTFKYLENTLSEIIKNDTQLKMIIDHLKRKRNYKIVSEIKRYSNN